MRGRAPRTAGTESKFCRRRRHLLMLMLASPLRRGAAHLDLPLPSLMRSPSPQPLPAAQTCSPPSPAPLHSHSHSHQGEGPLRHRPCPLLHRLLLVFLHLSTIPRHGLRAPRTVHKARRVRRHLHHELPPHLLQEARPPRRRAPRVRRNAAPEPRLLDRHGVRLRAQRRA